MICWKYWPGSPWYKFYQAGKTAGTTVLGQYYQTALPDPSQSIGSTGLVALDIETTGLNPAQDHILSIGVVHIDNLSVNLASAWHSHIYTARPIPEQSAVIHRITDDTAASASTIEAVMPDLLERLKGRILIAHHAKLETDFMNKICGKLYGNGLAIPVIDTEALARRRFQQLDISIEANALRLFNLRRYYNLPEYTAHNALSDAIAAAELFLAQASNLCPAMNCKLKRFITG